jgi:hypothetical protein
VPAVSDAVDVAEFLGKAHHARDRRQLYGSRGAAAFPLLVRRADVLAEVGSDDEFEVGLNALLEGFRDLI